MPFDWAQHCCEHEEEILAFQSTVTFNVGGVSVTVPMMGVPCFLAMLDAMRDGIGGDDTTQVERAKRECGKELLRLVEAVSHVTKAAAEPDCPYSVSVVTHDTAGTS